MNKTLNTIFDICGKVRRHLLNREGMSIRNKANTAELLSEIKAFIAGILFSEAWCFGRVAGEPVYTYISENNLQVAPLFCSFITLLLIVLYSYFRGNLKLLVSAFNSKRIDLLFALLVGVYLSNIFNGFGHDLYIKLISHVTSYQVVTSVLMPSILCAIWVGRVIFTNKVGNYESSESFFINDEERRKMNEDLLGITNKAKDFAEKVYNNGATDSVVFGVDAPWGMGKSSFINFCHEHWKDQYDKNIIVHKFDPLRYEDNVNVLEKLIDGVVCTIQNNIFIPELRPIVSRYSRFVAAKKKISLFGIEFEFTPINYTIDDAFDDLEAVLASLNKKVVVVIDDLDRLPFSAVKDVLFAIKKSFTLPNLSYVLCYDTENLVTLGKDDADADKIIEFFEKFINIKISLFLDGDTLLNYFSESKAKSLFGNSQANPLLVSKATAGLVDIFHSHSHEYHFYRHFVGDLRKIKRLLNIIMLLEVEKTKFEESDFDQKDLIHLLLIYINYPNIFRDIYDSETGIRQGFFSLVEPYDPGYPENNDQDARGRQNSKYYKAYIKQLSCRPRFLLNKLFDVSRLETQNLSDMSEVAKSSYACFNGGTGFGKNLEAYLYLLVKLSKPEKKDQHRFYRKAVVDLLSGTSIEETFRDEAFSNSESENSHKLFWRTVVNSVQELQGPAGKQLIRYLLGNITKYSHLEIDEIGVGLRDDLAMYLCKLLDQLGWQDDRGVAKNNTTQNILAIVDWVFGQGPHKGEGILASLSEDGRGVLGFYDLIFFRLFCCVDRGGDNFNLNRALSLHGNPDAVTSGILNKIVIDEMRITSQEVFCIFKECYITSQKNLFDCIDALSFKDLSGEWANYVKIQIEQNVITQEQIDTLVAQKKSNLVTFILYQLGNNVIGSGIGCGYYDEEGIGDKNGIACSLNKYLFGICFNPDCSERNYEHFVDYLLRNYTTPFDTGLDKPIPKIDFFLRVLNRDMLKSYWTKHGEKIKGSAFTSTDKRIETGNYSVSYAQELSQLFEILDVFSSNTNESNELEDKESKDPED